MYMLLHRLHANTFHLHLDRSRYILLRQDSREDQRTGTLHGVQAEHNIRLCDRPPGFLPP